MSCLAYYAKEKKKIYLNKRNTHKVKLRRAYPTQNLVKGK